MFTSFSREHIFLHEIITIPFLVLVILVYKIFDLQFTYFPAFIYWLFLIVITLFLATSVSFCFAKSFDLLFNLKLVKYFSNFGKLRTFLRLLLSVVLVLVVYENLQFAVEVVSPIDQDAALLFYDYAIFGPNHVTILLQPFITQLRSEWFSFAYLSFFFYLPILAVGFYLKNKLEDFEILILALTLTLFSGYILYVFFPALGPGVYLANSYTTTLDGDVITKATSDLVNFNGYPRGTFPSLHMACSTVFLYFSRKHSKWLFYIFFPVIISLWFSTLYLRHHYVIDLIAGFFLAVICIYVAQILSKKWHTIN